MVQDLLDYFPADEREETQIQPRLRLDAYPAELVQRVLSNETSHQLLEMAHIDQHGYPLITVMGFVLIDGRVHLGSRRNGVKLRRLTEDPRCSMNYHNKRAREQLACLTLVGRCRITDEPQRVSRFNEILTCKTISDDSPDVARRGEMIDAMNAARRVVIILDEVDAIYIQAPPSPKHKIGTPSRVISWRAAKPAGG
jgi:Pyridoxamine 5'-phosphate oxidase